jgi:hypothetical protein
MTRNMAAFASFRNRERKESTSLCNSARRFPAAEFVEVSGLLPPARSMAAFRVCSSYAVRMQPAREGHSHGETVNESPNPNCCISSFKEGIVVAIQTDLHTLCTSQIKSHQTKESPNHELLLKTFLAKVTTIQAIHTYLCLYIIAFRAEITWTAAKNKILGLSTVRRIKIRQRSRITWIQERMPTLGCSI